MTPQDIAAIQHAQNMLHLYGVLVRLQKHCVTEEAKRLIDEAMELVTK